MTIDEPRRSRGAPATPAASCDCCVLWATRSESMRSSKSLLFHRRPSAFPESLPFRARDADSSPRLRGSVKAAEPQGFRVERRQPGRSTAASSSTWTPARPEHRVPRRGRPGCAQHLQTRRSGRSRGRGRSSATGRPCFMAGGTPTGRRSAAAAASRSGTDWITRARTTRPVRVDRAISTTTVPSIFLTKASCGYCGRACLDRPAGAGRSP